MFLTRRRLLGIGGALAAAGLSGIGACSRAAPAPPAPPRGGYCLGQKR